MKKIFSKSDLFYKYLISYFIVLTIPFIFIAFFTFDYFSNVLKKDIIKNNQDMLIQVKDVVDMQLTNMKNISYEITSNSILTPYALTSNSFNELLCIQELKKYTVTNSFISELYLYIRDYDYLYSSSGIYSIPVFINSIYKNNNWSIDNFKNTINTIEIPMVRPSEEVLINKSNNDTENSIENIITYITPIPLYNHSAYGTIIYLIRGDSFKGLIKNILKDYDGNTIILDNNDKVITSLRKENYLSSPEFRQLIKSTNSIGYKNVTLDHTEYLFSYVKSSSSDWSYITLIPIDKIMEKVSHMELVCLVGLILVFIISSVIIYHVTSINYNPIKQLKDLTENKCGINTNSTNEIDSLRMAFDHMTNINEDLSIKFQNSKSALKEYLLFQLLKGHIYSIIDFNHKGKDVELSLLNPFFLVAIFYIHNKNDDTENTKRDEIISHIEKNLPHGVEGYGIDSIDGKTITFIFSFKENNESFLKHSFEFLHSLVNNEQGLQATIGIGNIYELPNDIGKSYIEASAALDYRFIKGNNKIIFFSEVSKHNCEFNPYTNSELQKLEMALKSGNTDRISKTLEDILNYIQSNNMPIFTARCLCFDVINTIIKTMNELNMEFSENKKRYPDAISLIRFETVEELTDTLNDVCFDICCYIKQNKQTDINNLDLKNKVILYVKKNYNNPNFSIQNMADSLNVSASYLSRYFKEQTKQNISDYVNHVRLEQAKKLLLKNNDPLECIVNKIGYYDVSSFIRKFKRDMGITPGEYRLLNKKKDDLRT